MTVWWPLTMHESKPRRQNAGLRFDEDLARVQRYTAGLPAHTFLLLVGLTDEEQGLELNRGIGLEM